MGKYRWVRTMPVVFSPVDAHVQYLGANVVFKTLNGGERWQTISPDLTRPTADVPASLGAFASLDPEQGRHRGVIYSIAPSFTRPGLLWVGTDDGLIHVTHDGGRSWTNVTPPALTPWSKVSLLEASHFDTLEVYAAVNRFRLDDLRPHIYRTKDGGKRWSEIVEGLPADAVVNAVREDPVRRGLLYARTPRSVYVSFYPCDHWPTPRLDPPARSVRRPVLHDRRLGGAAPGQDGSCAASQATTGLNPRIRRSTFHCTGSGLPRPSPPRRACTVSCGTCITRRRPRCGTSTLSPPSAATRRGSRAGRGCSRDRTRCGSARVGILSPNRSPSGWTRACGSPPACWRSSSRWRRGSSQPCVATLWRWSVCGRCGRSSRARENT